MSRWQRLLCRISPWYSRRMLERFALEYMRRNLQTALDREGLPFVAVINPKSSIKPSPSSWTDRLSRPAIEKEERPRGTAGTEAPAPTDTEVASTPRQDRGYELVRGGVGGSLSWQEADGSWSSLSTATADPTPTSSISTPMSGTPSESRSRGAS